MKQSVSLWQLMGFAVTSFSGTILHFLYEWLGEALWIAPFSGINESTWEHTGTSVRTVVVERARRRSRS